MSNSRKNAAVEFGLFVKSEKADKRRLNKAVRRATKALTRYQLSLESAKSGDFEEFSGVTQIVELFCNHICKRIFTPAQLALVALNESEQLEIQADRW